MSEVELTKSSGSVADWVLMLEGDLPGKAGEEGTFTVTSIALFLQTDLGNPVVQAYLPAPIEIPALALKQVGAGALHLATGGDLKAQLGRSPGAGPLWEDAKRRLAAMDLAWNAGGQSRFLGISDFGSALVRGHVQLDVVALFEGDGSGMGVAAGFVADISLQVDFAADYRYEPRPGVVATASLQRSCSLHLRLGAGAALGFSMDDLSLALPDISIPNLGLVDLVAGFREALGNACDKLAGLFESFGRYLPGLEQDTVSIDYEWIPAGTTPVLALQWVPGTGLRFAIAGQNFDFRDFDLDAAGLSQHLARFNVTVKKGALDLFKVKSAALARGSKAVICEFTIDPPTVDLATIPGGSKILGPLQFHWDKVQPKLKMDGIRFGDHDPDPYTANEAQKKKTEPGNTSIRLELAFSRVAVSLTDDPATVLAVAGSIEVTPSGSRITKLLLLEPSAITLFSAAEAAMTRGARGVLQLLSRFGSQAGPEMEGLRKVLKVLGKLAAGVARAGVQVGRTAGEFLEKTLSGVEELLSRLFDALSTVADRLEDAGVTVELRIGLSPFSLRQIFVTFDGKRLLAADGLSVEALGFRLEIPEGWRLALLVDLVTDPGAYLLAVSSTVSEGQTIASLGTDLFLKTEEKGPVSPLRDADHGKGGRADKPLLEISAVKKDKGGQIALMLVGLRRGQPVFLKRAVQAGYRPVLDLPAEMPDLLVLDGPLQLVDPEEKIGYTVEFQQDRVLPFFGMGESGTVDGGFLDGLKEGLGQVVSVKGTEGPEISHRKATLWMLLDVKAAGLTTELRLGLELDLDTFHVELKGGNSLFPLRSHRLRKEALGLTWLVDQANDDEYKADAEIEMFSADFRNGESGFALNRATQAGQKGKAKMAVHFDGLSADGEGVVLDVDTFRVGRAGLDLEARVSERPVKLNGVDVPFNFTRGGMKIAGSKLVEAVIGGRGKLPPDLVGDADCSVNLTFAQGQAGIVLQGGKVELEKKGDPIVCHSTRFTLTISDLDFGFARENGYHFYFLVTGSLRFTPNAGEFANGLLKNLADVEFSLERMPLTADARVLMRYISFQKALTPKRSVNLFNIFRFELRGFGFHPASPKFEGNPPAVNISGQIDIGMGDVMQTKIDFHGLWIAPPAAGESLPRIKADGLGVELQMAGSVKVRGTVLAVDRDTHTVEGVELIPPGYNASGFLGEGQLDMPGFGSMQATLGFMEVENEAKRGDRKKAFFLYLQANQLAVEIPTPFWTFYLREVGFGFGFRYTLAGIKDAESATSTASLIRILDDVSKTQGDLHRFSSWKPDIDKDNFTLAMKAAIQMAPADEDYDEENEKKAENPFFFDLVVALRSDFTFLMSSRAWLGVNYYNYAADTDGLRAKPSLRGFFYISVPRSEVLLRAVADPRGYIGKNSLLFNDPTLRSALSAVDYSATLYIRPGLLQFELGWPDQLAVRLLNEDNFKVSIRGGMVFRAAEDGLLYGFNIGAEAYLKFGGSIGSSVGVELYAELKATFVARLIAYMAWRFQDSLVYALVSLDAHLDFRVRAWLNIGFVHLNIGFTFSLQLTAAVELALAPKGIGARVQASVAVQAFGRTLGVGVGFAFRDDKLQEARTRVARFLAMSLTADQPASSPVLATPKADQQADEEAAHQDKLATAPAVTERKPDTPPPDQTGGGLDLMGSDFWLVLHSDPLDADAAYGLLLPRESKPVEPKSGFYAPPTAETRPHRVAGVPVGVRFYDSSPSPATLPYENGNYEPVAKWDTPLPVEAGGAPITLREMFQECFLTKRVDGSPKVVEKWKEPHIRYHGEPELPPGGDDDQRSEKRRTHQRECQADRQIYPYDEDAHASRSTVLTMFVDQFVAFASNGGERPDGGSTAHVTDLGLVCHGRAESLEQLAGKTIYAVVPTGAGGATELRDGTITVLNPQEGWFDRADPLLEDYHQAIKPDGIKLDWRLAPDLSATVEENPEHFLQYYEVRRIILNEEAVTTFKTACTVGSRDKNTGEVALLAPDWQFTDSMDSGNLKLPEEKRTALLPPASGADSLTASIAWLRAFPDKDAVMVNYEITPVDIAGTRGFTKSFAVRVERPNAVVRPATAELRVRQTLDGKAPQKGVPKDLEIYLAITDAAWDGDLGDQEYGNRRFKIERFYRLIVQPEEIEPAGHYGSDGATSRLRSPRTVATAADANEAQFEIPFSLTKSTGDLALDNGKPGEPGEVETDPETLAKLGRWALLTTRKHDDSKRLKCAFQKTVDKKLEKVEDESEWQRLLGRLWTTPEGRRCASRFALETLIRITPNDGKGGVQEFRSQRVVVPCEHVLIGPGGDNKEAPANARLRPEAFEWPQPLNFQPLGERQVQAVSGFARFKAPAADATLGIFLNQHEATGEPQEGKDATGQPPRDNAARKELSPPVRFIRDAERRILSEVSFAAVPDSGEEADLALISCYDLYELDLDELVSSNEDLSSLESNATAWRQARRVGRIEQLPRADAQLTPDTNKDLNGWQAHYPSETFRLTSSPSDGDGDARDRPLRQAWYSPRESTLLFPARRLRLRFFPQAPEDAIDELLRLGRPKKLLVEVKPRKDPTMKPIDGWTIPQIVLFPVGTVLPDDDEANRRGLLCEDFLDTDPLRFEGKYLISLDGDVPFAAADLRHMLLMIGFLPEPEDDNKPAYLETWLNNPNALAGLQLSITAITAAGEADPAKQRATCLMDLDFRSSMHPILEEVMGELAYGGGTENGGKLYRAHEVMVQPSPPMEIGTLQDFLTKLPPAADPYGWGNLQALGLAVGIRLFDTGSDEFVPPSQVAQRVNRVFTRVLKRWKEAFQDMDNLSFGQSFAEIHLRPARDREAGPFEAVLRDGLETESASVSLDDDGLCLTQVSLRPSPVGAWRYLRMRMRWKQPPVPKPTMPEEKTVANPEDWKFINRDGSEPLNKGDKLTIVDWARKRFRSASLSFAGQSRGTGPTEIAMEAGGAIYTLNGDPSAEDFPLPLLLPSFPGDLKDAPLFTLLARLPWAEDQDPSTLQPEKLFFEWEVSPKLVVTKRNGVDLQVPWVVASGPDLPPPVKRQVDEIKPLREWLECPEYWDTVEDPVDGANNPFERFEELGAKEWAAAFGGTWQNPLPGLGEIKRAKDALHSLRATLRAVSGKYKDPLAEEIPALAGAYLNWSQRFLDHGAGPRVITGDPEVHLALAAPMKALPWKIAADAGGCLGLTLLHSDRWSHTRVYAAKPLSRYHELLKGLKIEEQVNAEPLVPADGSDLLLGYAVTQSPRTEEILPPVISGTRRLKWNADDEDELDALEVVVARHGEEALAASNRTLFSRLGSPTSLLAFGRVYRYPGWQARLGAVLVGANDSEWPQPLPERVPQVVTRPQLDDEHQFTGVMLKEVARTYPSLWKGAEIHRIEPPPPEYKLVTLASQRAGVVVSDVAAVIQDDLPRRPLEQLGKRATQAGDNNAEGYKATMLIEADGAERGAISLSHGLVTHVDLTPLGAQAWNNPDDHLAICWWPDPDVSYIFQRSTVGKGSELREEDLEIRLGVFEDPKSIAIARARGTRFGVKASPRGARSDMQPPPATETDFRKKKPYRFTLTTDVELHDKDLTETVRLLPEEAGADSGPAIRFNMDAASFAAIFVPHSIDGELKPRDEELVTDYLQRLRTWVEQIRKRINLDRDLAPKKDWYPDELAPDLNRALDGLKLWLSGQDPSAWQTAAACHEDAKTQKALPLSAAGLCAIDDEPRAELKALVTLEPVAVTPDAVRGAYLRVVALAPTSFFEKVDMVDTAYPALARAGGRLRKILARRIMGSATKLMIRVVDIRARLYSNEIETKILQALDSLTVNPKSMTGAELLQHPKLEGVDQDAVVAALPRLERRDFVEVVNEPPPGGFDVRVFKLLSDNIAAHATPGLFEQEVILPGWLEKTLNPASSNGL